MGTGDGIWRSLPQRCTFAIAGLGQCTDTSNGPHGHHFRPGQADADLALTTEEACELTGYMANQYLDRNHWPVVSAMLDRIAAHVKAMTVNTRRFRCAKCHATALPGETKCYVMVPFACDGDVVEVTA